MNESFSEDQHILSIVATYNLQECLFTTYQTLFHITHEVSQAWANRGGTSSLMSTIHHENVSIVHNCIGLSKCQDIKEAIIIAAPTMH